MARLQLAISRYQTIVWFVGLAALAVFLIPAIPALESAIQRNAVVQEANRLVGEIQYARAQALKHNATVNLCRSRIVDACRSDSVNCRCLADSLPRQFESGWLLYTAPDSGADFDPDRDLLLSIGEAASAGIMIRGSRSMEDRLSLRRDGGLDHLGGVRIAVCVGDESSEDVPGRTVSVNVSGRPEVSVIPPGSYCLPAE